MSDQTTMIESAGTVDAMVSIASEQTGLLVSDAFETNASTSVPAQHLDSAIVTVKATGRSAYTYCVRAARRFSWFITVRARAFAAVIESRVRAFIQNVFPKTGADILRQSAILIS